MNYDGISFRDLIEEKAKSLPDRTAFYEGDEPYTYGELNSCADIMAQELSCLGVKKGTHVGLYGLNSANWIICFFAIQKLGAIGILLNPALKAGEVASLSEIADITCLCFGDSPAVRDEEAFMGELCSYQDCGIREFYSIAKEKRYKGVSNADLPVRPEADDAALMLFTSGSTGKPKCALLSAYNVLKAAVETRENQRLNADDRTCLILPLFHIFGLVAGLFANMCADSVMYLPEDIHAATLIRLIDEKKCTVFHAVPTMMLMILGNPDFAPEKLSSLRCTILSGAAATREQIEAFRKALPGDNFLSSYGLSEMAPVSTLPYGDSLENCIETVGKPMSRIKLKIADPVTGMELTSGESGEILVRGDNLMTGYYRVRVEDQSIDGEGWLHTGDLGYLREDGYLCLSGRLKELIIRGGENISPKDVSDAVSALEGIEDVKVVGVPSDFYGEEVCACIRLKNGSDFDEKAARERLKGMIARYKIPSFFLIYEDFPLLATGKVDMVSLKRDAAERIRR